MGKKCTLIIVLFLSLTTFLTGCWNNRPLKSISICSAIGIDKPDNEYPIEISAQIAKSSALGTTEQAKSKEKAFVFASLSANTFHGCSRNLFTIHLDRDIYVNHVQLIVIGEEYAKNGVTDALEYWERDHECNMDALVVVAKGLKATKVLQTESELQDVPAIHIAKTLKNTKATSEAYETNLYDALTKMNTEGIEMTLGSFQFEPGSSETSLQNMDARGAAAFKGDKLVGWLDKDDTKSLRIVENEFTGGVFDIANPIEKGKYINYELFSAKTKCELNIEDNKPSFHIKVEARGGVSEIHGEKTQVTSSNIKILESATNKVLKQMIEKTLYKAQHEFKSDIFGFGHKIYQDNPHYWGKIKDNWDNIYESMSISVDVKVSTFEFQAGRILEEVQIK